MAYSDNFPAVRPVFQADFANGGRIDPRATFSRASTGSYFGTAKHLSSENLFPYSASSSLWTVYNGASKADGAANGPDGSTNTAYSITFNNTSQYVNTGSVGLDTSASYTFSFYAKVASGTQTIIIGNIASGVFSNVTVTTDWQRFTVTQTPTATTRYPYIGPDGATGLGTLLIWGAQLEKRGSATALNETSGQIHREYASTLQTAASGAARFEHSAIDGQSMGCLLESSSTNLMAVSNDFSDSSWTKLNATASLEAIGPDGQLSAYALRESTDTSIHVLRKAATVSAGTVAYSIYAKLLGNARRLVLREDSTTGDSAVFDLSTGTVAATNAGGAGTIEDVGGGYYRCTLITTPTGSPGYSFGAWLATSTATNYETYTGDGYSGLLLFGAMVENSSFSSSYIDTGTGGSTATRAVDSLSVATADIPGFSEGVGTVVYETGGVASATATNQLAFGLRADSANFFTAGVNNGGVTDTSVRVYSKTSDGDQAFLNPGTATVGTGYKLACRYELDNIAASMNGGAVVSDTSGKVPVGIDTLWVGELDGNYHLNSNVKRIAVYGEALSDTNLQAITS